MNRAEFDEVWGRLVYVSRRDSFVREDRYDEYALLVDAGSCIVGFLIETLLDAPNPYVFPLLQRITGADPVPEEDRGRIESMTTHWLKWADHEEVSNG